MIKKFDISINAKLSLIIDEIETSLLCPKFKLVRNIISVFLAEDLKTSEHHNSFEKGFGFTLERNYEFGFSTIDLIINMKNCEKARLSDKHITAVIYHELGHILNEPELEEEPTLAYCFMHQIEFNNEVLEKVRAENLLKNELYADSYANKHEYGLELIETFYKQNEYFHQKIGFMGNRIMEIKNGEDLEGKISPFFDASFDC